VNKLSVLIPVFNEAKTIAELVRRVTSARIPIDKEILIGDDGSTDGTRDILRGMSAPNLKIEMLDKNIGRGGTLKHLLRQVTGDIVVHQDADLEYDPNDYASLLEPILAGEADVVYGSRFKGNIEKMRLLNNIGNRMMSGLARALYGVKITDLMTCYKMYRANLVRDLSIVSNGFEFEAEFTATLANRGARFAEVPIGFVGRSFEEGKKIRSRDALRVIQKLISGKLSDRRPRG
jgi:glycosyltransferase involved in cell wall biosynthesis